MKSLVYNLDEKFVTNQSLFNSLGYDLKLYHQTRYNELIKELYNNNFFNDTELLSYFITIDDPIRLEKSIEVFNNYFIRNDKELFDTIRNANLNNAQLNTLTNCLKKISNCKINNNRKKTLILNSWLISNSDFSSFIIKNNEFIDDILFEILINQAKKEWNDYIKYTCQCILKSDRIKDKNNVLEALFNTINSSYKISEDAIYKFGAITANEELSSSPKELEKMLFLLKQSAYYDARILTLYIELFKYPEISNDLKLRDYFFDILIQAREVNDGIIRFKIILDACFNENVRNNEEYLNILKNSIDWQRCYLLNNVFQCEELSNNQELMDLILSMPNYFCLEQLLLAYETEAINKDINILRQIAGLIPFADKMEDVRLCYGTNTNEMVWMARYDKFTEGRKRQRILRYFKKD